MKPDTAGVSVTLRRVKVYEHLSTYGSLENLKCCDCGEQVHS